MRLKASIFLWVFLATAVPICIVTLYAVSYSERLFQQDVDREIGDSLDNIASEIRRRLLLDRDLLSGISRAPPVKELVPVLEEIAKGENHSEFRARRERLQRFFNDIQGIISPTSRFRVLDVFGRTLVSVSSDQVAEIPVAGISQAVADNLDIAGRSFPSWQRILLPGRFAPF